MQLKTFRLARAWIEATRHYPSDILPGMALGHFLGAFINDAFLGSDNPKNFFFSVGSPRTAFTAVGAGFLRIELTKGGEMCSPRFLGLILVGALFLSGCANVWKYPGRSITLQGELQALSPYLNMETVWADYQKQATDEEKATYRDEVINAHIYAIDLCFNARAQAELYGKGTLEAAQDLAGFGLSLASSVAPLSATKTLLASISTGIQGGKGPMNEITEHVFFQKSMPVILYKNMLLRDQVLKDIKSKMENKHNIKAYPLAEALADLEKYYEAGTLYGALAQLLGGPNEAPPKNPPGGAQGSAGTGGGKPDQQTGATLSPSDPKKPAKPKTPEPNQN